MHIRRLTAKKVSGIIKNSENDVFISDDDGIESVRNIFDTLSSLSIEKLTEIIEPMIIALLRKEISDSKITDAKITEDYKKFFGDIVEEFREKINISIKHKKGNLKGVRYNSQTSETMHDPCQSDETVAMS